MNLGPFAFPAGLIALWFGLVAALAATGFLRRRGLPDAGAAVYLALIAGLLLARLAYVLDWRRQYLEQPLGILNLRDGGFDPVAGLVGLVLAALLIGWCRPALRKALAAGAAVGVAAWGFSTLTARLLREAARPPMPVVVLRDLEGRPVPLQSLRGRPLVINLWATWCGPCRSEMPMLVEAQRRLPQVRFAFVDQGENAAAVAAYLRRENLAPRHMLIDGNLDMSAHYGVRGYPATLFLDADGILRDQQMGELSRATLADRLRRIAPQPGPPVVSPPR
ncbi:MAG TPA: TlpA disulfide reductase family protein [Rhodanobacter sp.]